MTDLKTIIQKADLKKWMPSYAIVPLATCLSIHFLTYYASRHITTTMVHTVYELPVDEWIPLYTPFVIFYLLAYCQWGLCVLRLCRASREDCHAFFTAEIISKIFALLFFTLLPSTVVRPVISGDGFFDNLVKWIYSKDQADNLLPSLHCLESWVCYRGMRRIPEISKRFSAFHLAFTILVFCSTLLIKQHLFLDVVSAVALGEVGIGLEKTFHVSRIFDRKKVPKPKELYENK